jgi:hypothetical protein
MNGGREIPKQKPVVHALEHWRNQPDRTFQNSTPVSMLGLSHVAERFPKGASLDHERDQAADRRQDGDEAGEKRCQEPLLGESAVRWGKGYRVTLLTRMSFS